MKSLLEADKITITIGQKIPHRNISFQINQGDIWGLLGPNGSGKTTLLHTLAGLHPTHQGDIYLQDKKLSSLSRKKIASQIGILFQDTEFIFPQTVLEFCQSGRHPHETTSTENEKIILSALGAMELETKMHHKVQTLSGGEKRRLAISAVLTQTPKIYLLDEPTNHLDLRHQVRVLQHFKSLSTENSNGIIMATHDINIAHHFCNNILMLFNNGEILQGRKEDLLTSSNLSRLFDIPIKSQNSTWIPCV